jgi:hypothetical protein
VPKIQRRRGRRRASGKSISVASGAQVVSGCVPGEVMIAIGQVASIIAINSLFL